MTVCQFCGTKLMDGAQFCYKCERKLEYLDGDEGSGIADSVISHSTISQIGTVHVSDEKRYCPSCNTPLSARNRSIKCHACGTRFCAACEADFRDERRRGERPYCDKCYAERQKRLAEERARREAEVRKRLETQRRREAEERARREVEERKRREAQRKREAEERAQREVEEQKRMEAEKKKEAEERAQKEMEERVRKEVLGKEPMESSIGMKFRLIPVGEFMMGAKDCKNAPPHHVRLTKSFYLGIYQVTQREWKAVMGRWKNPSFFKGDDHPVEKVSWDDCQKFIAVLNRKEGTMKYRLPTEAEWEYACRAGSTTRYCCSDSDAQLGSYAWFRENSGSKTHPVGTKASNAWGLHDMHGNVWEWCGDWYSDYPTVTVSDPQGPSDGSYRVGRGGSWGLVAASCTAALRGRDSPARCPVPHGLGRARSG